MQKATSQWTTASYNELKAEFEERFASGNSPDKALAQIISAISQPPPNGTDVFLWQFVLHVLALEAIGQLPTPVKDWPQLFKTAEEILTSKRILPKTSRLAHLYQDLHSTRARIEAISGQHDLALWSFDSGLHFAGTHRRPGTVGEELLRARGYLRAGHSTLAISTLKAIEPQALESAIHDEFLLELAKALRLIGHPGSARAELCRATLQTTEDWRWQEILCGNTEEAFLRNMLRFAQKAPLPQKIEAKFWAFASGHTPSIDRLSKHEALRRNAKKHGIQDTLTQTSLTALRLMESAHDSSFPMAERLRFLSELKRIIPNLVTIELEMLTTVATAKILLQLGCEELAQVVFLDYQALSMKVSNNNHPDILNSADSIRIFDIGKPKRPVSQLGRLTNIASTAVQGASYFTRYKVKRFLAVQEEKERISRDEMAKLGEMLFSHLGTLKGGVMKVGQVLAQMAEASPEFKNPMERLLLEAPPVAPEHTLATIRNELGGDPQEIFAEWNPIPFAVASIGQVYRARLHSGELVAVKVQHPHIKRDIAIDLKILPLFKPILRKQMPIADIDALLSEVHTKLMAEVDYAEEVMNTEIFGEIFAHHKKIRVPKIYRDYCTEKIITTEYIQGRTFRQFMDDSTQGERDDAGMAILQGFSQALFSRRMFNCDPHPGNYLFMDDGKIAFLDFGCVKEFSEDFVDNWREICVGLMEDNLERFTPCWQKLGYFSDLEKIDIQDLYQQTKLIFKPLLIDEDFAISKEYIREVSDMHLNENSLAKHFTPPPEAAMTSRMTWGLMSLIAELAPKQNWHQWALEELKSHAYKSAKPA